MFASPYPGFLEGGSNSHTRGRVREGCVPPSCTKRELELLSFLLEHKISEELNIIILISRMLNLKNQQLKHSEELLSLNVVMNQHSSDGDDPDTFARMDLKQGQLNCQSLLKY